MPYLRSITCLLIALVLPACSANRQNALPLPKLPDSPIKLRVAYVVNPRLPQMTPAQIETLLATLRTGSKEYLGVTVEFEPIVTIPIADLFARIPEDARQIYTKNIYDFRSSKDSWALEVAFGREFKADGDPIQEMMDYSRPYIGNLPEKSYEALGSALAKHHLATLEQWRQIPALDGKPSIDDDPYNEFALWVALGYGRVPYELVLTNQLIASVETKRPAVHSSLRGGYSNGITTYSQQSRFGTMSVWSTFAFTANDAWTSKLREGEIYSKAEAAQLAGLSAIHELGHQLFHFGHPYAQTACIMSPVPMLAFRRWSQGISAKSCPLGSSPAMTPGAYTFLF